MVKKRKKQKQIDDIETAGHINKSNTIGKLFQSSDYREKRYVDGGNSGAGSYADLPSLRLKY